MLIDDQSLFQTKWSQNMSKPHVSFGLPADFSYHQCYLLLNRSGTLTDHVWMTQPLGHGKHICLSKVPMLAHLESNANLIAETPGAAKWLSHDGYPNGAAVYMVCHGSHPYTPVMLAYNVTPGLINHGLLIRGGYSSNSHDLILKWYPPN